MTPEETAAFLRQPLISYLSTVRPDGAPHVTPLWHHYDGTRAYVVAEASSVKVENIRNEPRVVLCVPSTGSPHEYVLVRGVATLTSDSIPELVLAMSVNYMDSKEEAEAYTRKALKELDFIAIEIAPERITSWTGEE